MIETRRLAPSASLASRISSVLSAPHGWLFEPHGLARLSRDSNGTMKPETVERIFTDALGRLAYIVESLEHGDVREATYVAGDLERDVLAHVGALKSRKPSDERE